MLIFLRDHIWSYLVLFDPTKPYLDLEIIESLEKILNLDNCCQVSESFGLEKSKITISG